MGERLENVSIRHQDTVIFVIFCNREIKLEENADKKAAAAFSVDEHDEKKALTL